MRSKYLVSSSDILFVSVVTRTLSPAAMTFLEASKSYGRLDEVDSTSIDVEHEVTSDIRINQTRGKRKGDVCRSFNVFWNRYGK